MPFPADVLAAVEQTVARFVADVLGSTAQRRGQSVLPDQSRRIAAAATDAGLLRGGDGLGLWSRVDDVASVRLTLRTLTTVATARTGIAYHLHHLALGDALAMRLEVDAAGGVVPLLDGALAHASAGHARLLAGESVRSDTAAVLSCDLPALDAGASRVLYLAEPWQALLAPVIDVSAADATLRWLHVRRDGLHIEAQADSHGLDDAPAHRLTHDAARAAVTVSADGPAGVALLRQALGLEAAATVALGLGALYRALAIARDYARERVQGGVPIIEHAAVQELLGEAAAIAAAATAALAAVGPAAANADELAAQLGLRAALLPRLTAGANACLQALGGAGYMRDYGVEACVRDLNHLRTVGGSPSTLQRMVTLLGEVAS